MITTVMISLFALAALGAIVVLADCSVRGWQAYRLLARENAAVRACRAVRMEIAGSVDSRRLPNLRQQSVVRASRASSRRQSRSALPAVA